MSLVTSYTGKEGISSYVTELVLLMFLVRRRTRSEASEQAAGRL
jgi:hypothetical protein